MLVHPFVSGGAQNTHHGRTDAQGADLMPLHHIPDAIRVGIVGSTLENHHRRAEEGHPDHLPGSHHPANVGYPEEDVISADIEREPQLLGYLSERATMGVHGALRAPG